MKSIVVIGASSGGLQAVSSLVGKLPKDMDAALFLVIHVAPMAKSILPELLSRAGKLKALHVRRRRRIKPNLVHVAPPNRHLVIKDGFVTLSSGPRENRFRPSIDALFRRRQKRTARV